MVRSRPAEEHVRLSQSFIWPLQTQYYESLGIDAWLGGSVPSRVTTNSHIAKRYARLVAAYARDVQAKQLRIVELGAGHGRFGFLCAKHLHELFGNGHGPRGCDWKYVLTDVAATTFSSGRITKRSSCLLVTDSSTLHVSKRAPIPRCNCERAVKSYPTPIPANT
ncbi:MAG: hypothetical protein U0892_22035 [Pirellulales bacterium]